MTDPDSSGSGSSGPDSGARRPPVQFLTLATTTTWSQLQALMTEMTGAAPYWRTRSTAGLLHPADGWHSDWDHQFRLGVYKYLEWCDLLPRPGGRGLTGEDIEQACLALGFEIERDGDRVRVLGYRRLA